MTKHSPDEKAGQRLAAGQRVSRILQDLADLSFTHVRPDAANPDGSADELRDFGDILDRLIQARRKRGIYFPEELVSSPAWDILLELLQAKVDCRTASLASLCAQSTLPATAAVRWLDALEERGLVIRRVDNGDRADELLELTPTAYGAFRAYFEDLGTTTGRSSD